MSNSQWRTQGGERAGRVLMGLVVLAMVGMTAGAAVWLLHSHYVETPLDQVWPRQGVVGVKTVVLPDGAEVTVATPRGYHELDEEEIARRKPVKLRVRAFRGESLGAPTHLWVNVIDDQGRVLDHLEAEDFEVLEGEHQVPHVEFLRNFEEQPPSFAPPFIWIANSGEDTVSKLATSTGEELGRYPVGDNPSRTSVDLDGNVFVAARDGATISRIQAVGCEGAACVKWTLPTCRGARGLAVDAQGRIWVGGSSRDPEHPERGCLELRDGDTGEPIVVKEDLDDRVYGLAFDQNETLWAVLSNDTLLKISRAGRVRAVYAPPDEGASLYGLAVDFRGKVWIGGFETKVVWRFDPVTEQWDKLASPNGCVARGVAADIAGNVWVANSNLSSLSRFDARAARWVADYRVKGTEPVGVAIDSDQFVWVVNKFTENAAKMDPETGDTVGFYQVGDEPYTYSDMTGYALNNFVAQRGAYRLGYHPVPFRLRLVEPERGDIWPALGYKRKALRVHLDVYDPNDPVTSVTYFIDDQEVGTAKEAPFDLSLKYDEMAVGAHTVRAVGRSKAGYTDEDETVIEVVQTYGQVRVEMRQGERLVKDVPRTIELVIDSSGSMWGRVDGRPKIDVARDALAELLASLPKDTTVALRAYGHRSKRCDDTALLVPPGPPGRAALGKALDKLRPRGRTPIAHALQEAAKDLSASGSGGFLGERMVVMVTDGIETCKGDPCAVAADLDEGPVRLRVNVVGFALDRGVDKASLKCMADATGGSFLDAEDDRGLIRSLERAVRVGYNIVDEQGKLVQASDLERASTVLPVGRYKVRFGAQGQEQVLESELFTLESQQEVIVSLSLKPEGPPEIVLRRRALP